MCSRPLERAENRAQRERHQQRFLNEVAAVVDRGRGQRDEGRRGERGPGAKRQCEREEKKNGGGAKERRHQTHSRFVELGERVLTAEPSDRNSGIVKRRTVMVARIERVTAVLEELAQLHRLVRFVGVHGAARQVARAQPVTAEDDHREQKRTKESRRRQGHVGPMKNKLRGGARRRIGSPWQKHWALARGTVAPLTVNSTSANSATFATPCLLPIASEAQWFSDTIRPHERELRAYLRGRFPTLPDVDDLVQETYARLWRSPGDRRETVTRAYLFVVARNVALDLVRREKVIPIERLTETAGWAIPEERPDAAETVSRQQELQLLDAAMRALPPRCREILTLRRIEGLSHRAIAEKLGIAEGTVNAQLAIGLMRCRQFLCAHGVARACINVSSTVNGDAR